LPADDHQGPRAANAASAAPKEAAAAADKAGDTAAGEALQLSSSQKHILPFPPPSVMQTWSTMKRLISMSSVHERLTFLSAANEGEEKRAE